MYEDTGEFPPGIKYWIDGNWLRTTGLHYDECAPLYVYTCIYNVYTKVMANRQEDRLYMSA